VPILVFHRLLCSQFRPDLRDRQTDVRCASSLNASYPRGGGIIIFSMASKLECVKVYFQLCLQFIPEFDSDRIIKIGLYLPKLF